MLLWAGPNHAHDRRRHRNRNRWGYLVTAQAHASPSHRKCSYFSPDFLSEWKLYWLNRTPTAPSSFKAALIQPRLKYQQRNSSRRCFTELIPGNSFLVRATQLRHQTRIHCPTFHQRMESGAAEAAADSARWQGELWAPVEIEKGRIEFDGTLWLPLNRFAFFLL